MRIQLAWANYSTNSHFKWIFHSLKFLEWIDSSSHKRFQLRNVFALKCDEKKSEPRWRLMYTIDMIKMLNKLSLFPRWVDGNWCELNIEYFVAIVLTQFDPYFQFASPSVRFPIMRIKYAFCIHLFELVSIDLYCNDLSCEHALTQHHSAIIPLLLCFLTIICFTLDSIDLLAQHFATLVIYLVCSSLSFAWFALLFA